MSDCFCKEIISNYRKEIKRHADSDEREEQCEESSVESCRREVAVADCCDGDCREVN